MSDIDPSHREPRAGVLERLRCPVTRQALTLRDGRLATPDGAHAYRVNANGIPLFAESFLSEDARRQQVHYDRIAAAYIEQLDYPHTQVYVDYLDRALTDAIGAEPLGVTAELCCGRGEAMRLLADRVDDGLGLDISEAMLNGARNDADAPDWTLVQGDATRLPLADGSFDTVVMLGGIHHVNDREALFSEVARILRPGGRFVWREPVSDFILWRALRAVIYRLSPALDHETERPLLYDETVPVLARAGLALESWRTYGYAGFCLFMNSDVLIFNRLFRFVPGIRAITRGAVALDDLVARLPGMRRSGLQVVGVARRGDKVG